MKRVPVIVYGAGGVGSALLAQIVESRVRVAERNGCQFDVVAVTDSRSWVWNAEGLSNGQLRDIVVAKKNGRSLTPTPHERPSDLDILNHMAESVVTDGIVVDVTAVNGMEPVLDRALELGYGVALANKKAFAGPWVTARRYFNHPRVRHESTVGGGQPVIATLRYLLDVNDPIYEIEGQMSGTLGFICGCLDKGIPFSQAVAEAKAKGFTEPDPREDLGGQDVMRKVLILARMAGWSFEADEIRVESLYPAELAGLSVGEFLTAVSVLDQPMAARAAAAAAEGKVLRYTARVEEGRGVVGLQAIPAGSALANMKYISFRTERYNDEPLLIGGKGAGVEMTAAGVLGDMIDLVREAGAGG
ncbi:MAG: homoserine dehydrogenase [Chloroflexota bacterium]